MPLPRLLKTPSFRLAALSALLFSLIAMLVFGLIYWASTRFIERQIDQSLLIEMASLESQGQADMAQVIAERLSAPSTREFIYLLQDRDGQRMAGNLPPQAVIEGWQNFEIPDQTSKDGDPTQLRAFAKRLANGGLLLVARDMDELDELTDFMENSFAIGFAVTLAVALGAGMLLGRNFLRRLDKVNASVGSIMAGELHRRIPVGSGHDEFSTLSVNLNHMLDRIQELMEGMQQVTNDIAHDMRTPLSRLRQRLERARITARSVEEFEQTVDAALEDVAGLQDMFGALLRIAQIESKARRAGFQSVDLSELAQTIFETYQPVAEDGGRSLTAEIEPGVTLPGDQQLLSQLLVNLVENALCHTPAGSMIRISVKRAGGVALLSVADNGPGIPETERPKVLRRFYRMDASRHSTGFGLGLSMVSAIAGLHHGQILLEDNQPGLRVSIGFML